MISNDPGLVGSTLCQVFVDSHSLVQLQVTVTDQCFRTTAEVIFAAAEQPALATFLAAAKSTEVESTAESVLIRHGADTVPVTTPGMLPSSESCRHRLDVAEWSGEDWVACAGRRECFVLLADVEVFTTDAPRVTVVQPNSKAKSATVEGVV